MLGGIGLVIVHKGPQPVERRLVAAGAGFFGARRQLGGLLVVGWLDAGLLVAWVGTGIGALGTLILRERFCVGVFGALVFFQAVIIVELLITGVACKTGEIACIALWHVSLRKSGISVEGGRAGKYRINSVFGRGVFSGNGTE